MASPGENGVASIDLPTQETPPDPEPKEKVPENGIHNKVLEQVVRTPGRQPSPQPTHLSVPGPSSSQHRILPEEGPGYVAPKFEGKELQMDQGRTTCKLNIVELHKIDMNRSDGSDRGEGLYPSRIRRIRN